MLANICWRWYSSSNYDECALSNEKWVRDLLHFGLSIGYLDMLPVFTFWFDLCQMCKEKIWLTDKWNLATALESITNYRCDMHAPSLRKLLWWIYSVSRTCSNLYVQRCIDVVHAKRKPWHFSKNIKYFY